MDAPLVRTGMSSPRPAWAPMRSQQHGDGGAAAADLHSVRLSAYDGRLLLDRGSVPQGDTFADDSEGNKHQNCQYRTVARSSLPPADATAGAETAGK